MKRRSLVAVPASLGPPSVGRSSQSVDCVGIQVGDVGFSGSVTICPVVSSRLSSRLSIWPPPVRPAPGISSFPSLSLPLPPAHFALGCDDVGERILAFDAGASVARPLSFVPSVSVCSSDSSLGSLHSAGSCTLPSRSVVSTSRSVKFSQSRCGNVSAQRGRRIAAASYGSPGMVSIP